MRKTQPICISYLIPNRETGVRMAVGPNVHPGVARRNSHHDFRTGGLGYLRFGTVLNDRVGIEPHDS